MFFDSLCSLFLLSPHFWGIAQEIYSIRPTFVSDLFQAGRMAFSKNPKRIRQVDIFIGNLIAPAFMILAGIFLVFSFFIHDENPTQRYIDISIFSTLIYFGFALLFLKLLEDDRILVAFLKRIILLLPNAFLLAWLEGMRLHGQIDANTQLAADLVLFVLSALAVFWLSRKTK